jgi:hypothetical protein
VVRPHIVSRAAFEWLGYNSRAIAMGSPLSLQPGVSSAQAPSGDRLDGWKDIACQLGRGVRTAQRWERDLGLPVRRLNTGSGEAVFAYRSEIDAWLLTKSQASLAPAHDDGHDPVEPGGGDTPAAPLAPLGDDIGITPIGDRRPAHHGRWRWWTGFGAGALVVAIMTVAWHALENAVQGDPVSLGAAGATLTAYGPTHEPLWTRRFDVPLDEFRQRGAFERQSVVRDLDGDGRSEVVVALRAPGMTGIYAWDARGRERFVHQFTRPVRMGEYACPPTHVTNVQVDDPPRFPHTFWAWGHHPMFFPAVLERIDAAGHTQSEYWSNGFITAVASLTLRDRPVTLVGAANNDQHGASVAAFFGDVNGAAPSANPAYQCRGCPAGQPDVFLVFPRSRLQAALGGEAEIVGFTPDGDRRVSVAVRLAGPTDGSAPGVLAYYHLDQDLRVESVEFDQFAEAYHQQLEASGQATPATRFRREDLLPVKYWAGSGWTNARAR